MVSSEPVRPEPNFRHASLIEKNSRMIATKHMRRLDSLGRLVIPIKLREKLGLDAGFECNFFTHEENGKMYLCIECPEQETDLQRALKIIEQNGLKAVEKNS